MQNAANKSTVRIALIVPAVLCFFCAVLSMFLLWSQVHYGKSLDNKADRDRVFDKICASYSEQIRDSINDFFTAANPEEVPLCPSNLVQSKTNLRISWTGTHPREKVSRTFYAQDDKFLEGSKVKQEIKQCFDNPENAYYYHEEEWEYKHTQFIQIRFLIPDSKLEKKDAFYWVKRVMQLGSALRNLFWALAVVFFALALLFAGLFLRSALREGKNEFGRPQLFRELPPDLLLIVLFPAVIYCVVQINLWKPEEKWIEFLIDGASSANLLLLLPIYITALFGAALLWASVVLFSLCRCGPRGLISYTRFERAPFTFKTIPVLLFLQSVKAVAILLYAQGAADVGPNKGFMVPLPVFLLLEKAVLVPVFYRCLREMRQIASVTDVYAQGDLTPDIMANTYYQSIRNHAEDIDSIVQRIRSSADEYIRSNEFKAEMITNLSHDIKTPLTSIINYAALLQNPKLSAEDRARYLDVLARHSRRMSRLVEDLTQVSDAQTGKIEAHPAWMDLSALVMQSALGFEERLQGRGITIRFFLPNKPVFIMADTRLMWRVSDNLMNNICKYAAPNSEVQIGVSVYSNAVTAFYANTPDKPLTISGDALMERFVRADSSRHTEGNGLGLSIARSIMHVQGGELRIETQPNQFTAYIVFGPTDRKGE